MNNSSFEHVYSRVIGPDLARKHRITNVYKLPRIKGVVLHIHSKQLISNLKEIRPVYNRVQSVFAWSPALFIP
jgi:ribosomal protein L5